MMLASYYSKQLEYVKNRYSATPQIPQSLYLLYSQEGDTFSSSEEQLSRKFSIASITKSITAMGILFLIDQKKLSLETPLDSVLPATWESKGFQSRKITILDLLRHRSGIPYRSSYMKMVKYKGGSLFIPEQIAVAGERYFYSNYNYYILKAIIEKVSGKTYSEYLKESLLDPLGMQDTQTRGSNGAGGIITSLRDLAKFGKLILHRGRLHGKPFISEQLIRKIWLTALNDGIDEEDEYGLGWHVQQENGVVTSLYHAGNWFGTFSLIHLFPQEKGMLLLWANPPNYQSKSLLEYRWKMVGLAKSYLHNLRIYTLNKTLPLNKFVGLYRAGDSHAQTKISLRQKKLVLESDISTFLKRLDLTSFIVEQKKKTTIHFVEKDGEIIGFMAGKEFYNKVF
ncbi:MAG: class A beta-lactamase-related serine hydrolase [Candidatus Hydrogenedentota bacterium]|nr:MAG: class A beta-lactamase-related serine hydrolase [Candidatus Hydrogenedentota bacterium]